MASHGSQTNTVEENSGGTHGLPKWCTDKKYDGYWKHRQQVTEWFNTHVFKTPEEKSSEADGERNCPEYYAAMADYHFSMAQAMLRLSMCYDNWNRTWFNSDRHPLHATPSLTQSSSLPRYGHRNSDPAFLSRPVAPGRKNKKSSKRKGPRVVCATKRQDTRQSPKNKEQVAFEARQETGVDNVNREAEAGAAYEMEITDEMLQFFAHSAKHRKERDARKLERAEKDEAHVNLGDVSARPKQASAEPPNERPGYKRTKEMKELYGEGAAMIHGMETAMQLTYDRNCDRQQPKLWPHLPLNITF